MSRIRYSGLILCCLLPVACSVTQPPALEVPSAPAAQIITPSARTSPAVVALLNQASNASQNGDLQRAGVLLERAVRIEPRNATLWNYLAKLRLHQGRAQEAMNLAAKSNALAGSDYKLKAANWRIIAHARFRSGDIPGAKQAESKADALLK